MIENEIASVQRGPRGMQRNSFKTFFDETNKQRLISESIFY